MKKRILLIDDDETYLEMMTEFIEKNSAFEIIPSKWPEMVLETIRDYQPAAILTDTNMPKLNGVELLTLVKKQHPNLPVLMLFSGLLGSSITKDEIMALGAHSVMTKPEAAIEIINLLQTILVIA